MTTQREMAAHLFIDPSEISRMISRGIIKKGSTLDEAREAAIRYWRAVAAGRKASSGRGEGDDLDLVAERARLTHHQANKTALEEDILRRRLIPAEDVAEEWSNRTAAMRAKLLALPTKLATAAMAATSLQDVQTLATDEIYAALGDLSAETDERAVSLGPAPIGEGPEAAAALNS